MTKKTLLFVLFAALACLGQEGPPPGGPPPRGMEPRMGPGMMGPGAPGRMMAWWKESRIVQAIGVSQDQVNQIEQIVQQSEPQLRQQAQALRTQDQQLRSMLDADQPDTNAINSQIDQIAQARASLEKAVAHMQLSIRGVLTTDQWRQLQAEMQKIRQNMRQRMQERRQREPRRPLPPQDGPGEPQG